MVVVTSTLLTPTCGPKLPLLILNYYYLNFNFKQGIRYGYEKKPSLLTEWFQKNCTLGRQGTFNLLLYFKMYLHLNFFLMFCLVFLIFVVVAYLVIDICPHLKLWHLDVTQFLTFYMEDTCNHNTGHYYQAFLMVVFLLLLLGWVFFFLGGGVFSPTTMNMYTTFRTFTF